MPFDFKKEYKEFYLPKEVPALVTVPEAHYLAVRGAGDPNEQGGDYQAALNMLYAAAYTLRMSQKSGHALDGFFDYVVPPLEGLWWHEGVDGVDYSDKRGFQWVSLLRLPDFVTEAQVDWAKEAAARKKKLDCGKVTFLTLHEGLCVQMLHVGPFDSEPKSVAKMDAFLAVQGCVNDFSDTRLHHEIYLSDARRVPAEKWRTVIRHPVRRLAEGGASTYLT